MTPEERLRDVRAAAELARRNPSQEWLGVVYAEDVGDLLAALDAARAERDAHADQCADAERMANAQEQRVIALLSRLEALEQRYRRLIAACGQSGDAINVGYVAALGGVVSDLAALRKEMGQ